MKNLPCVFVSILVIAIIASGCGSSNNIVKPPNINIDGNWSLVYLYDKDANTLFDTQIPSMNIDQSKKYISGTGGCNTFSGQFTFDKGTFNAPNLTTTLMMCSEKNNEMELMQAISGESKVSIIDGLFTFSKDDKIVAQFKKGIENPLLFGNWTLESIDGQAASVLFLDSSPTLSFFTSDKSISGYAGCNNYNASYTIEGFTLQVGSIMTTRMACQNSSSESKFLKNISGTSIIKMINDTIILSKDGKETLKFTKK